VSPSPQCNIPTHATSGRSPRGPQEPPAAEKKTAHFFVALIITPTYQRAQPQKIPAGIQFSAFRSVQRQTRARTVRTEKATGPDFLDLSVLRVLGSRNSLMIGDS